MVSPGPTSICARDLRFAKARPWALPGSRCTRSRRGRREDLSAVSIETNVSAGTLR